jgi:hypothetical protein
MLTHFRRLGSSIKRYVAKRANPWLQRRLTDWAAGPRTTIPQIRTALDEVLKNEPNPDWEIAAIKSGYLELMRAVEQPMPLAAQHELEGEWTLRLGDMKLSPEMVGGLEDGRRFLLREPERSRRVLKLLCASYLAHVEPREVPPRNPAVWARFSYLTSTNPITKGRISVPIYPVGPEASDGALALTPRELAGWLVATLDARLQLVSGHSYVWPWPPDRMADRRGDPDRKAYRALVLMLATELYQRERGSLPPSDLALFGTYLKSLPDDSLPDVDDGTARTVISVGAFSAPCSACPFSQEQSSESALGDAAFKHHSHRGIQFSSARKFHDEVPRHRQIRTVDRWSRDSWIFGNETF